VITLAIALIALFFALLTVADLLPSAAERRAGVSAPLIG
jgi:hypothetical protein